MTTKKNSIYPMLFCIFAIGIFSAILIIPSTRDGFGELTAKHPFIMAFIKFSILATAGELIAVKLATKTWSVPKYIIVRALIWGVLGLFITMAFKIFGIGVLGILEQGIIPGGTGLVWKAFMTSFWCNLFFAPFMMGLHKLTDGYLDLKSKGEKNITLAKTARSINWEGFITFSIAKTIPLFWIPAHTITFMLPGQFQTIMAAYLSIALGIILNIKKRG